MLPVLRQRILIAVGVILGGIVWMRAQGALAPSDASSGITLFDASAGPIIAAVIALLAGLPAIVAGLITSGTGHPLSGVFVVAFALMMLAAAGGSIDGFLWRSELPGRYGVLMLEMILWTTGWLALLLAIHRTRAAASRRYPKLADAHEHFGRDVKIVHPSGKSFLAGLIAAGVGGLLSNLLIQSAATGQVIGSLILAFAIGALVAQMIVPQSHPLGILLAPTAVAVIGYAFMLVSPHLGSTDAVLRDWYRGELPGLVLALPIQYASAGMVGCTLGIGLGQSFDHARTVATNA